MLSGLEDAGVYERYVTALYWSFSTLCTVGYGDVTPGALYPDEACMRLTIFGHLVLLLDSESFVLQS